jgi:hypothetical protein
MGIRKFVAVCSIAALPAIATAQDSELRLPSFNHLQGKAIETVDITLGQWPIRFAAAIADDGTKDGAMAKELLSGLKSVRIRSYKFDYPNAFSRSEVDSIRKQLNGGNWMPLAQMQSRAKKSNVDIFVSVEGEQATGLAVVAVKPREFTIVNISGRVDPKQIGELSKRFHFSDSLDDAGDEDATETVN